MPLTTIDNNATTGYDGFSYDPLKIEYWSMYSNNYYARVRCGRNKKPTFKSGRLNAAGGTDVYVQCANDLTSSDSTYDNSKWY